MSIKLINMCYRNVFFANKAVAVVGPDAAPIRRMIQEATSWSVKIFAAQAYKT